MSFLAHLAGSTPPGDPVLYLIPHQDDEVLTCGAAIRRDVLDGKSVRVMVCTDGGADSGSRPKLQTVLGYDPSRAELVRHRDMEFAEAVRRMGAAPILPTLGVDRIGDGGTTPENVAALAKKYGTPDMALRGTSNHDYHTDHRNMGNAVTLLQQEGWGVDHRHIISGYKSSANDLPYLGIMGTGDLIDSSVVEAYRHEDIPADWWGVGYKSVAAWFDYVLRGEAHSYWHRPGEHPQDTAA